MDVQNWATQGSLVTAVRHCPEVLGDHEASSVCRGEPPALLPVRTVLTGQDAGKEQDSTAEKCASSVVPIRKLMATQNEYCKCSPPHRTR